MQHQELRQKSVNLKFIPCARKEHHMGGRNLSKTELKLSFSFMSGEVS